MKRIMLSVNSSWNIINFRRGVIRGLIEADYHITIVAPRDEYTEQIAPLGANYSELPMAQQGMSIIQDCRLFVHYLSCFKKFRPDVYVSYTTKPNIYGSLAARLFGVPAVNNIAGLGNVFVRGGLLRSIVKQLYRLALAKSSCVFFQNVEDRNYFIDERLVQESQADLLPGSGVSLDEFKQSEYVYRTGDKMKFLFVGRLLKDKGVIELVEAARIVKSHYPSIKVSLLGFVGVENPSALSQEEVDAWVAEDVIEYHGACDDVRPYLRSADCVILPSAYKEGTPRSLIEAGAIGIPLIATDIPGCRDIVNHGVNGYLCKAKSHRSVASAMIKMIRLSYGQRLAMANASRSKIVEGYDEKVVVKKYLQAVSECS